MHANKDLAWAIFIQIWNSVLFLVFLSTLAKFFFYSVGRFLRNYQTNKKIKYLAKMHSGFHEEDSSLDCRKLYVYLLMHFLRPVAVTGEYTTGWFFKKRGYEGDDFLFRTVIESQ